MTTSYCNQCGSQLAPGDPFCASCGAETNARGSGGGAASGNGCPNCASEVDHSRAYCDVCGQVFVAVKGIKISTLTRRVFAYLLEPALIIVTLVIGYIIWWLFALRHGQTPGKQLLGIRVIRADGRPSNWGWTFIREFVIKLVAIHIVDSVLVIVGLIDLLWAFWDKDRQTIHDKIMKTLVIDDREYRADAAANQPSFP